MATVNVNDIDIYYEAKGHGPPLVLIMGFSANSDWWPPEFIDALAAHYRVIIFDNRGSGRSGDTKVIHTMSLLARDTVGLLDALDVCRAHIFGISMGGMIAQAFALAYPQRVDRLILGCTTCGLRGAFLSKDRGRFWPRYFTEKSLRKRKLATHLLFSQEFLAGNRERLRRFGRRVSIAPMPWRNQLKQIAAMLGFDAYGRLPDIKAPTLVMTGTLDFMVVPRNADILARRIPQARLETLAGCGHAFIAEAEEAVIGRIIDFLGIQ